MSSSSLLSRIHQFQSGSSTLEPDKAEYNDWLSQLKNFTNDFLTEIRSAPASQLHVLPTDMLTLDDKKSFSETLNIFNQTIVNHGLDTASSRYLGFIPCGGIPLSAFADYLAALTNRYAGHSIGSPGAVAMEKNTIQWMNSLVGFPETATGNLTSGGSYSILIALVTARETHQIKARDIENTVIYVTTLTHHAVAKSLRTIGLQEAIVRQIPVDADFKMDVTALQHSIVDDKEKKLKPFLIVATAGATDTGSIDPLTEIGAIAKKHQLWLHIDAAYGGFFMLTEYGKKHLHGMSLADSITLDPHKGLFLPYGIGAILIKNPDIQKQAFSIAAACMQDAVSSCTDWSPSDMSPELSKHFRALRMWMPLKYYGIEPFKNALDEKLLLAQYFYTELQKIPHIQIACAPQLSVVSFRYMPAHGDANAFNKDLLTKINCSGKVFLSSTTLNGDYYIRMACLSFRTHLEDIELTLEIIADCLLAHK